MQNLNSNLKQNDGGCSCTPSSKKKTQQEFYTNFNCVAKKVYLTKNL